MNKIFACLLISSMIVGGFSTTYTCPSSGIHSSYDDTLTTNCIATTGNCMTGYSDVSNTAPANGGLAGICKFCAPGYTDSSAGTANTAAITSVGCIYCATNYKASSAQAVGTSTCISTTLSSSVHCDTLYSDVAPVAGVNQATTTTAGVLAAPCKYCDATAVYDSLLMNKCVAKASGQCAAGYSDNAPDATTGANKAGTASGTALNGNCKYCGTTTVQTAPLAVNGSACVSPTDATLGKCATGFTDSSTGAAASAAGALKGNCVYCLLGWSDVAPVNGTNSAPTKGGAVGACSNCAAGYTLNATTSKCDVSSSASSSSFLMVSISLIATLFMIFF